MQRRFLIVLVFILLLVPTIADAHTDVPLPFELQIKKNITLPWTSTTTIDPAAQFTKLEGGGFCRKHKHNYGHFKLQFYLKNEEKAAFIGEATRTGHPDRIYFELGSVLSDKITYGAYDDCCGIYCGYMGGSFEALRNITKAQIQDQVKINQPPEQLGTFADYGAAKNIEGNEKLQVASSNPYVLVWVGEKVGKDGKVQQTTTEKTDFIYGCVDLDEDKECDSVEAQNANCVGDWYKDSCCSLQRIQAPQTPQTQGCAMDDKNAYCGKDSQEQPFFAMPEELGQIHHFDGCTNQLDVVYDDLKIARKCERTSTTEFITIKEHQYYCDPTIPKFTECGGEQPHSTTQALTTGQNITIQDKTNYCLENGQFSINLDGTTKNSCEKAGLSWTGNRCCSEADDRNPNEYYSDTSNDTNTATPGGCWNSTFVRSGDYTLNYANNTKLDTSIINYNGSFYGCELTDQTILGLRNTDPHSQQAQTTTGLPLIALKNKCGTPIKNAKTNASQPHAVCQPVVQWQFVTDDNDTTEKFNPFGPNEADIPVKFSQQCDKEFQTSGCCPTTKCWNGKSCSANEIFFDAGNKGYWCKDGNWQGKPKKYNFNRQMSGFCPRDEQCLVSSVGQANFDDQPEKFFTATSIAQQPRCINNTQYLKDEYCDGGNWTTRTKLIATQLLSLTENLNIPEYDLFCDSYDNVLNNVRYSYGPGQSLVENFIKENCVKEGRIVPCTNNFCILKTINEVSAIATSLNTPINSTLSFLKTLNLTENDCDNTLTATQFTKCTPTKPIQGEVWHNPTIESIIYLPPQLQTSLADTYTKPRFKTVMKYVATKHIAELPDRNFSFFNQTRLFNKLMYSKKGPRTIFAFLEQNQLLPPLSYLGVAYTNFSLGTDPCLLFKTALTRPVCEKQINNSDFVLIAKDNQLPTWRDLTAKLRLVAGPPRQITTDTGATTPQPRQLQTRDPCA